MEDVRVEILPKVQTCNGALSRVHRRFKMATAFRHFALSYTRTYMYVELETRRLIWNSRPLDVSSSGWLMIVFQGKLEGLNSRWKLSALWGNFEEAGAASDLHDPNVMPLSNTWVQIRFYHFNGTPDTFET